MRKQKQNTKSHITKIYNYLRNILAIIGLVSVIHLLCFEITVIYSNSMAPTLKGDNSSMRDYVLTEKVSLLFRKPRRWDILKFHATDELESIGVLKRVVGLPGETIAVKDYWININSKPVERPAELDFLKYVGAGCLHGGTEVKCEGGYFMLGDDAFDSYDSRFTGLLKPKDIEGRALMIIWPPSRIRFLRP